MKRVLQLSVVEHHQDHENAPRLWMQVSISMHMNICSSLFSQRTIAAMSQMSKQSGFMQLSLSGRLWKHEMQRYKEDEVHV